MWEKSDFQVRNYVHVSPVLGNQCIPPGWCGCVCLWLGVKCLVSCDCEGMCVCVCVREREKEQEKQRQRQRERREKDRETERGKEKRVSPGDMSERYCMISPFSKAMLSQCTL